MGMTIEEAIKYYENKNVVLTEEEALANTIALNTMRKYQQLQADYENRLKADMVAMLTDIQLEIEEIKPLEPTDDEDWQYGCFHGLELMQDKCLRLIQQKIDKIKEAKDGENNY